MEKGGCSQLSLESISKQKEMFPLRGNSMEAKHRELRCVVAVGNPQPQLCMNVGVNTACTVWWEQGLGMGWENRRELTAPCTWEAEGVTMLHQEHSGWGSCTRLRLLGGSVGAEQLHSHHGQNMHPGPGWIQGPTAVSRVVTFIKHCEEHHKLLLPVPIPIALQSPCKMPWDGSL